jgi:hypothetical protein
MRNNQTLYKTDQFKLISHGYGLSYEFISFDRMKSIFLQGDDALTFQTQLIDAQDANPYATINATLSFMWFEYELIAKPIVEPANWPLIISHAEMIRA